MSRVVGEEWRQTGGRVFSVVEYELSKEQEWTTIRERRRVASKDVFEDPVDSLRLAIRLRMCCRRYRQLRTQKLDEAGPECGRNPLITVGDTLLGQAVMAQNAVDEVRRGLGRGDCVANRDEVHHLREPIHEDQDARSTFDIGREPEDEIHGD
ncbi:hypothetical protein PF008_g17723 [Phytophthora fragariae]|uniref:Uncharacterized protein n=1 Tax=Phytophthora fragariae TaxID=53985 RepID=A0A6G0R7H0_9STRA|nr:hypothetical protein PF008_g17723 [Phytophthora fragariae]